MATGAVIRAPYPAFCLRDPGFPSFTAGDWRLAAFPSGPGGRLFAICGGGEVSTLETGHVRLGSAQPHEEHSVSVEVCSDICTSARTFGGPLDLSINTILDQMTQYFKTQRLEAPKAGDKQEAEDSCLPCRASLCDDDAQSHTTDDLLVDSVLDLKESVCEKHNRPRELFCKTDRTCVCRLCVEDDHGEHTTVPVEREWFHRHIQLKREVLQVKQEILDRRKKMEEIRERTRLSREDAEKELKEGLQVLSAILRSVEKCQMELTEAIEGKQKAVETRAQSLLEDLEQEIKDSKTRKAELKQLLHCQDYVHILQSFPSQPTPPCSKDWDNVVIHTELCVGIVRRVLSPYDENFRVKLRELMDAEFKKIQQYAEDVRLDPLTAQRNLVVSENGKEVRYQERMQIVPDNPERFDTAHSVLGKQTFTSGRHYWEVQVEGKTAWYLGVVTVSICRKKKNTPLPRNGLWILHQKEGENLKALDDSHVELSPSSGLKKVGVYVDYEEGQISFYNVETRLPMFSFTGNTFTEKLCLFLNPQKSDTVPMILSPVS
ncbi:E3 ubiquitin-protein ligase TRIM39-like [Conger conger]|uniref:E3 ubiquitin-protein ligase TRIM39-like n=1 Tax=Conger conger TaxID=82655 RepID=UPI002A5AE47D|nr:E3 ubiquitin-protein ligase TRIM39-like [Conger conger]